VPTVLTHALVGASLGAASRAPVSRLRLVLLLAVLSMLPDADVLAFWLGIPYAAPLGHRGFSHSLAFAALAGPLAVSAAFPSLPRFSVAWGQLSLLAVIATASHGLLDAATDAGLGVGFWLPFDGERYFLPWRPLATSPIGLTGFVQGGASVLASEGRWLWAPLALVWAIALAARRIARPRGA